MSERATEAGLPEGAIAFTVRRLGDDREVREHRATEPMPPASTIKLLTSIVALETLGPAWRGATEIGIRGTIRGDRLYGDVVLRGLGDVDFDVAALRRMLQRLALRGVREIRGDLLLDRTYFSPARADLSAPPFDEAPEFRYNVVPDALLLNANLVDLELVADRGRVRVASWPPIDGLAFDSRMKVVDAPCESWEDLWRFPALRDSRGLLRVTLQGDFPSGCAVSTSLNVLDRTRYAEGLVRSAWRELGGRWSGHAREADESAVTEDLGRHLSRPLAELVRDIDKKSDNPIARTVFLALGATSTEGAGAPTAERAAHVVRSWLVAHGLDASGLVLENGSGLSRIERVSPALLAGVVSKAMASRWAPEFESSLPIAAVDGGMRKRLVASPAAASARIKTGTLRDVSAVAGLVRATDGTRYVVVAMIHHDNAKSGVARPVLDALIDWVSRGLPED